MKKDKDFEKDFDEERVDIKENSGNPYKVIILVLLIVLICILGFIFSKKADEKLDNNMENDDVVETPSPVPTESDEPTPSTTPEEIVTPEKPVEPVKPSPKPTPSEKPSPSPKPVEPTKVDGVVLKPIDKLDSLEEGPVIYNESNYDYGLSPKIGSDKKSIELTIVWDEFGPTVPGGTTWAKGQQEKYIIKGFTNKIAELYVYGFGHALGNETIFALMENGTVEYVSVAKAVKASKPENPNLLKVTGKVSGVKDVIKIRQADVNPGPLSSGYISVVGITPNGTFYDLTKGI